MTHQENMTCAEFESLLGGYLDEQVLTSAQRATCEMHTAGCAECAALVADVRTIVRDAGELPVRSPSRDLWSGIESRIEAPVVSLISRNTSEFAVDSAGTTATTEPTEATPSVKFVPVVRRVFVARLTGRQMALAASLLVAVTAGVTYRITKQVGSGAVVADGGVSASVTAPAPVVLQQVARQTAEETFDREIASLRKVVSDRRAELDSGTVAVLERNLKLIDQAIAESKAALAKDPASAFLEDRLTRAYDTKLQLLRGVATIPQRS